MHEVRGYVEMISQIFIIIWLLAEISVSKISRFGKANINIDVTTDKKNFECMLQQNLVDCHILSSFTAVKRN